MQRFFDWLGVVDRFFQLVLAWIFFVLFLGFLAGLGYAIYVCVHFWLT